MVVTPGVSRLTGVACSATSLGPSNSSTRRLPSACVGSAESMVHSTSTRRCALSTSTGRANMSDRNASGSTRSLTSR